MVLATINHNPAESLETSRSLHFPTKKINGILKNINGIRISCKEICGINKSEKSTDK
tara:strand:- start:1140 stop:1310 length:171 start_codon:yes stop_codon:yes gene_type:complete